MNDREASTEACRENAAKGFAFTESELPDAELEHRRKTRLEMEAALLDFPEVSHELRGELALEPDELADFGEQIVIGPMTELHAFWHITPIFELLMRAET